MAAQEIKLPVEAKIAVGVAAVAVGTAAFLIFRKVINDGRDRREEKEKLENTTNVINTEADAWEAGGQALTMPALQYIALADQIELATEGPWYDPTNEDAIYSALMQLKNNRDYLELVKAYGMRDGYTLQSSIQGDMSPSEIAKCNQILQSSGITYRI